MPKSSINTQYMLSVIANIAETLSGVPAEALQQDLFQLDSVLKTQHHFPWEEVAARMGLTRQQAYRWYYDTHQRRLFGPVSDEDIAIIRRMLRQAIANGENLGQNFQRRIKEKLSKEYQRNSFTVAFNNSKRLLLNEKSHEESSSKDSQEPAFCQPKSGNSSADFRPEQASLSDLFPMQQEPLLEDMMLDFELFD